jgi:L-alanine-DL-glutamate epimerase-like enolase superfamily enzyme
VGPSGAPAGVPAYQLLGYARAYPKLPYASVLFGATPEETRGRAADIGSAGFRAGKFGWAPFGESLANDVLHIEAAREGLGREGVLLIDAGQIFGEDVEAAALRLSASLQPYAGLADHRLCEYSTNLQPLARDLTLNQIKPDANGEIVLPDAPGLGIEINPEALARYKVDVEIRVKGKTIFSTPST